MNFHYHLGRLAGYILKPLFLSYRYQIHFEVASDSSLIFPSHKKSPPLIYAAFHQHEFNLMPYFMHRNIVAMVSNSKDGSLMAGAAEYWGYLTVRGSSHRGGNEVFHQALNYLHRGFSVSVTVDGPKGPIFEVKRGVVTFAERSEGLIVPISANPHRAYQFQKSWEKSYLPYPFSKIDIYVGEIKKYNLEELQKKLLDLNQYCAATSRDNSSGIASSASTAG